MQVISDTTISKGFVVFQFPLTVFGNLIFSFPTVFLPLFVTERIPANLQHLCAKLSRTSNRVHYELSWQDSDMYPEQLTDIISHKDLTLYLSFNEYIISYSHLLKKRTPCLHQLLSLGILF